MYVPTFKGFTIYFIFSAIIRMKLRLIYGSGYYYPNWMISDYNKKYLVEWIKTITFLFFILVSSKIPTIGLRTLSTAFNKHTSNSPLKS